MHLADFRSKVLNTLTHYSLSFNLHKIGGHGRELCVDVIVPALAIISATAFALKLSLRLLSTPCWVISHTTMNGTLITC